MFNPISPSQKLVHQILSQHPGDDYVNGWAEAWAKCDTPAWDRGYPSPALEDALIERRSTIGSGMAQNAQNNSYRRKALVPGCGRGVDVFLIASFGYDAYGLDYSPGALEACKQEEEKAEDKYPVRDPEVGRGKATFVRGDFFSDDWLNELGLSRNCFDLIYDYTFFCALVPSMRPKWALRHSQLLAPSPAGNLICLEFPRHKDPLSGGPPYPSASEAYFEHLSHPGEEISYDSSGVVKSNPLREPSENGMERVLHWKPARTHDVGKGENGEIHDRVSVWRRRT